MRLKIRAALRVDSEHLLLLKGWLLVAVVGFAFIAAWHFGLLQQVWREDPTGLSVAITLVFLLAAGHGSRHVLHLSRILNHLSDVQRNVTRQPATITSDLPKGRVTDYIRDLDVKASLGGPRSIDQALLLDTFEAELRCGHGFGWFIADLLLTLGLLGTVVGFILMLGPISALDTTDHGAIKAALAAMSGGMAVALYTTLTGLIGGMLLKIQGFLLENAVDELLRRTTWLTEVHVLPAIERERRHAPV